MAYNAKVLVVDDDPDTVELLTKRLGAEGYSTLGASDGKQAIHQANEYGPDVIILDIKMPKMDGYEVCKRLKSSEDTRLIPVIMLTVKAKVPDKVKGLDIGADDYIPKPFDFREISRRVRYWSTLKKRVEERVSEIKRLEQELIKSERLAAIGQTVGGIAHYMKNVLFGLKGGVYLVNVASKEHQSDSTGWEMVERNMGRMSDLVLDLLEYSKDSEPEYERCLPNEIAGKVCEEWSEKAGEHRIEIVKDFDPSLQEALLDPKGVQRCLENLVSNAVDACIFDPDEDKKWAVHVRTTLEDDTMVRFEVADNGCGMNEEIKGHLFTHFFTTKEGKGTGLGLLNTQKIVKQHGGSIAVDSEPGKGSTFTIRLPYQSGAEA